MSETYFVNIRKGFHGLTGNWVEMYVVNGRGIKPAKFKRLNDAKARAIELGASGKFIKSMEPQGPRGRMIATYSDADSGRE